MRNSSETQTLQASPFSDHSQKDSCLAPECPRPHQRRPTVLKSTRRRNRIANVVNSKTRRRKQVSSRNSFSQTREICPHYTTRQPQFRTAETAGAAIRQRQRLFDAEKLLEFALRENRNAQRFGLVIFRSRLRT